MERRSTNQNHDFFSGGVPQYNRSSTSSMTNNFNTNPLMQLPQTLELETAMSCLQISNRSNGYLGNFNDGFSLGSRENNHFLPSTVVENNSSLPFLGNDLTTPGSFVINCSNYYNRDVCLQDFVGVEDSVSGNYGMVLSGCYSNSNGNGVESLVNLDSSNHNAATSLQDYETNWRRRGGFLIESQVMMTPRFGQNGFRNSLGMDSRGVNMNMNGNGNGNGNGSIVHTKSSNGWRNGVIQQGLDGIGLSELRGMIVSLATDQNGCRLLQSIFEDIEEDGVGMIFVEVIDSISGLMVDQFGNYLVQKLVEICSEEQRTQILLSVTKSKFQLISICLNMHGTRVVQKLLKHLSNPEQISLVISALSPGVVTLVKDNNGHHVIDYCVKNFSDEDNKFLLNEVAKNCYGIATDKSGCCVLQSCVEHSQGETREHLVSEIIENARLLAEDRYGNYVLQHILGLRVPRITANLLRELQGHYFSLSCNKYGSNVVEKCLKEAGEQQSAQIISELLRNPNVSMLLLDPFGNYIVQTALSVSQGPLHNALVSLIQTNSSAMQSNLYGKKILTWFHRRKLNNMYRNVAI